MITQAEREAFVWMQGRMVELLLRHDNERFDKLFRERHSDQETIATQLLKHYRNLAVLFYLRDELFEHILPRIKHRLSFEAPRETQTEELPSRGRIDWGRTARATWNERPTEAPLEVITRQRRRHFATPPNLLTVCTLLEYRTAVQVLLDQESARDLAQSIRHPLHDIADSCTRELAFLQFAGLVPDCEEIVNGYANQSSDDLEQKVADNLLPGSNSAYPELLQWRAKFKELRLLDRLKVEQEVQPMLGADPNRDNYLYQLWLFYEIGEMLEHKKGCKPKWDYAKMQIEYTWGEGEGARTYRLQHDQSIAKIPTYWKAQVNHQPSTPGVRPDFYIERLDRQQVMAANGQPLWHEPGYVLDAKYYKPRDTAKAPSSPVKRMIADLQLTGERHGALLFAFQEGQTAPGNAALTVSSSPSGGIEDELEPNLPSKQGELYRLSPVQSSAQYVQPDLDVSIWRLQPISTIASNEKAFHAYLAKLLQQAHQVLQTSVEVRCRGIFLDSLSTNAHSQLAELAHLQLRHGGTFNPNTDKMEDLLLCPKPHVAPWRVDIVSVKRDCCQNPELCHIVGLASKPANLKPPIRLVTLKDIEKAFKKTPRENPSGNPDEENSELIRIATIRIKEVAEHYRELIQPNMEDFRVEIQRRVGKIFTTTPLLTSEQRETLALGCFLQKQIEGVKAANFAGPALLFTGVLEELIRKTLYERSSLRTTIKENDKTLGRVSNSSNLYQIRLAVSKFSLWKEQLSPKQYYHFDDWVQDLGKIVNLRNNAAHHAYLNLNDFDNLLELFFNSPNYGPGVFDGLLLAWQGT